jgi:response regulator RpfG family c-di-GMP phosphodiesterase
MADETQNKLEILIVEDREENRNAAKQALENQVDIDFATNYEDGLKKMQTKVYAFGIFDLELPRKDGMQTEKLGFELETEAKKYVLDYALITAGIDHHDCKAAFVRYCFDYKSGRIDGEVMEDKEDPHKVYEGHELRAKNFQELTEIPKTNPEAWETVYEKLLEVNPNVKNLVESKKRYFDATGKMYMKREESK